MASHLYAALTPEDEGMLRLIGLGGVHSNSISDTELTRLKRLGLVDESRIGLSLSAAGQQSLGATCPASFHKSAADVRKTVCSRGSGLVHSFGHTVKEMRTTMATTAMILGLPFVAAAQSADVGARLAERWCMACHVVETGPRDVINDGVPTFPAIAAKPSTTAESVDRYLSTAHTNMPDFSLSRSERNALVAYILSLR